MKWDIKEEEIIVKFYLNHPNDWRSRINEVMNELTIAGFISRDENSTRMRISNVEYLDKGIGLANSSKQTQTVYNKLKK